MVFAAFIKYLDSKNVTWDKNGNTVSFKRNGLNYVFDYDERDPFYFRLALPKIFMASDGNVRDTATAVNGLNSGYKVIKAVMEDRYVWLFIEQFIYSADRIDEFFDRAFALQEIAYDDFNRQMETQNGEDPS